MILERLARAWIRAIAPRHLRETLLDDLDELRQRETAARGAPAVDRGPRLWIEALRATPHLLRLRLLAFPAPRRRPLAWLRGVMNDVRCGLRALRREPTFALTAILTLAIGVATTTSVFSVADAELWKPLPYPDPDRLVAVYTRAPGERAGIDPLSGADLLAWRAALPAFSDLAAEALARRRTLLGETAETVLVSEVTANFFETLGTSVVAGRAPGAADLDGSAAGVLTDRGWRRLFAGDPSIVGRVAMIDGDPVRITGVLTPGDWLNGSSDDLLVILDERAPSFLDPARPTFLWGVVGRLRPGVDAEVARQQLQALMGREEGANGRRPRLAFVDDLRDFHAPSGRWRPLFFFLAASLAVLLLSSVNVAMLLLVRAVGRTREFALRGALGGGPAALFRQLLVEGLLLAAPAAGLAIVLTQWILGLFVGQLSQDVFSNADNVAVDVRVAVFAIAATSLTTLLFAVAPMLVSRRIDFSSALGGGTRAGRLAGEGRARTALLTLQVAITVVLLAGAGIFLKSFMALLHVPLGFDPANTATLAVNPTGPRYASDAALLSYADRLLEAARAVPGVRDAAVGTSSPLGSGPLVEVAPAAAGGEPPAEAARAILRAVTPDFFRTLRMTVRRGRPFSTDDAAGAPRVAIVNESLARQAFGDADPIGRLLELRPGARAPWTRRPGALLVVGVVTNVKDVGLNEIEFGNLYVPLAQMPGAGVEVVVHVEAGTPGDTLRRAVGRVDPAVPIGTVTVLRQRVDNALRGDRFNALLISSFAAVALTLAAIGIFGAVASHVQARTREFGVQLALGAPPRRLVLAALSTGGRLGLLGSGLGLLATPVIAAAIGDALYLVPGEHNGMLYGVTTTDPAMLAAAFGTVMAAALAAGAIPARRIMRVDPVQALRAE